MGNAPSAPTAFVSAAEPDVEPIEDIRHWWARHRALDAGSDDPFVRAVGGGFAADRLGYAFAAGYHEALRALVPGGDVLRSLAVTEEGPPTPSSIRTVLRQQGGGARLDGRKGFATLGAVAEEFLVAARRGDEADAPLALVSVPRDRAGLRVLDGPQTSFTPEVPHAVVVLEDVHVEPSEVLEGDGYLRYLKPFRTVEDTHVHAATLGFLYRLARRWPWPEQIRDAILTGILALSSVARDDPLAPGTHLGLGAVLSSSRAVLQRLDDEGCWDAADRQTRERWLRDRELLRVAGAIRAKRLERARERIAAGER